MGGCIFFNDKALGARREENGAGGPAGPETRWCMHRHAPKIRAVETGEIPPPCGGNFKCCTIPEWLLSNWR